MSEREKGPFEPHGTAIYWLAIVRQGLTEEGQRKITSAIRVLEAAGKVDKKASMKKFMSLAIRGVLGDEPEIISIMEFLESLPDDKEKP